SLRVENQCHECAAGISATVQSACPVWRKSCSCDRQGRHGVTPRRDKLALVSSVSLRKLRRRLLHWRWLLRKQKRNRRVIDQNARCPGCGHKRGYIEFRPED